METLELKQDFCCGFQLPLKIMVNRTGFYIATVCIKCDRPNKIYSDYFGSYMKARNELKKVS